MRVLRKMAVKPPRWMMFLFVMCSVVTLTTCSSDDPAEPPSRNTDTIGPAGGTVSDAGGAWVEIPPGALTQDVKITVETYQDPETGPYPVGPVPVFWGGARFGPTGTEFALPVTVVLPTRQPLDPGAAYQLFVHDPDRQRWEITKESATVTPDGRTLVGEVSHFSVFNGGGGAGGPQVRSDLTVQLCRFGSAQAMCDDYIAYFKEYVAKVGDKGVYDDQCKEVVGLYMDVTCEINGDNVFVPVRDGVFEGEQVSIFDPDDCGEGDGDYGVLEAFATIYYKCGMPEMSAVADPAVIDLGGASTVTATLTCGEMGFPNRTVLFAREGVGRIAPNSGVNDAVGRVRTTFSNSGQEGSATVTAGYSACAGLPNAGSVVGEAEVNTVGGWTGTLTVDYDHPVGSSPLDNFSDRVTIDFSFAIDGEGNLTGSGSGTHAVTVTPGGDCWTASVDAPGFMVIVAGTATAQTLEFSLAPSPMMPVSFVITCPQGEEEVDYPYPLAEGLIEGEILTRDIAVSVARSAGATATGSGSRDDGTDLPMDFIWNVTVDRME